MPKKLVVVKLTRAEAHLVQQMVEELMATGVYWGKKTDFYKRRDSLGDKIAAVLKE